MLQKHTEEVVCKVIEAVSEYTIGGKRWLKNQDLMKELGLSYTALQNLRINGLPYTKLGGTIYYDRRDLEKVMSRNKVNNKDV